MIGHPKMRKKCMAMASAQNPVVYMITNRLTINLTVMESAVQFLMHLACLNGCVCVNSKIQGLPTPAIFKSDPWISQNDP